MDIFFELVNHFIEKKSEMKKTARSNVLERLGKMTEYIDANHADDISLEDIASHFCLSREYFSRFFKKNMGITFTKYLNQVRLMHAYQDICNKQEGILEVVEKHGFTSYKVFYKMFHEVYGCTPRELRNNGLHL